MKKLTTLAVALLLLGAMLFPSISSAQSVGSLQAQINSLLAEVQQLEAQLAATGGSTATWCYTFNMNLSIGMSGSAVTALQTALQKDGESVTVSGTFDDQTASAVTGFQEKYASQILAPNGLQYGTGYAGPSTRAELNVLFGCNGGNPITSSTTPTITVTAPAGAAGGQNISVGSTYTVQWTSTGVSSVNLSLCTISGYCSLLEGLSGNVVASQDSFSWYVDPNNLLFPGDNFRIEVTDAANGNISGYSGYFSVVAATTTFTPSLTILSPTSGGGVLTIGQSIPYEVQVNTNKTMGGFSLGLASINSGWPGLMGNNIPLVGSNGYSVVPSNGIYSGTATYSGSLAPGTYYLYASWNSQDNSEPVYAYSNFSFIVPSTTNSSPSINTAPSTATAPSGVGTVTAYLYSNEDSTLGGVELKVNGLTATQLNVTVTDHSTGQTQTVILTPNNPMIVAGHDMMVTSIQSVSNGTVNGQPTYNEEATLSYE